MIRPYYFSVSRYLLVIVVTVFGVLSSTLAKADNESRTLVFRENIEQAPYIYRAKGNKAKLPQGYLPALLKYFMDDHQININFIEVPRNRLTTAFDQRKLDASLLSPKWVPNPDEFVFTQPLGVYRSVLMTDADTHNGEPLDISQLKSAYICTRRGYRYPHLDKFWESNNLIRVDFSDELLQLKGLKADRCQYAVLDKAIADWYIKRHFKKKDFVVAGDETTVPLTLGFHKDKAEMAALFDSTISRLAANGELKILQRVFGVTSN